MRLNAKGSGLLLFLMLASPLLGDTVELVWNKNSEADVAGYNVYRSFVPGSAYVKLNRGLIRGTGFEDHTIPSGSQAYYVVSAVSQSGWESEFSKELEVTLEPGPLVFPQVPNTHHNAFQDSFLGAAMVNPHGFVNRIVISGLTGQGVESMQALLDEPLSPQGQGTFLTSHLVRSEEVETFVVRGDGGPLRSFFMMGSGLGTRMDGVAGRLPESTRLYFPMARTGSGGTTLVFLFNPSLQDDPGVRLTLRDLTGQIISEKVVSIASRGSVYQSVESLFDSVAELGDGYLQVDSQVALKGFEFDWRQGDYSSSSARQASQVRRLIAPHFFTAQGGGDTEIRLVNVDESMLEITVRIFDDLSTLQVEEEVRLTPTSVWVASVGKLLSSRGKEASTGHIDVHIDKPASAPVGNGPEPGMGGRAEALGGRLLGSVTFSSSQGSSATLPMQPEGSREVLFLQVAQSQEVGMFTGIALLNPGTQPASVEVTVHDRSGEVTGRVELPLPAGRRVVDTLNGSRFLGWEFSQVGGHVRVVASVPVVSFALFGDLGSSYLAAIEGTPPLNRSSR